MLDLVETYSVALVVALLIGLVAAFWAFRRTATPAADEAQPPTVETSVPAEHHAPVPVQPDVAPFVPGVDTVVAEAVVEAEAEAPAPAPAAEGPPDDLQTLKGVGAKFAARLNELGVSRFDQLAGLGEAEMAALDDQMGAFKGRLARDRVIEQAGFLARGDIAGFEAAFGKLGGSL